MGTNNSYAFQKISDFCSHFLITQGHFVSVLTILKNTSKIETVIQQIFLREVKDNLHSNVYIFIQFDKY